MKSFRILFLIFILMGGSWWLFSTKSISWLSPAWAQSAPPHPSHLASPSNNPKEPTAEFTSTSQETIENKTPLRQLETDLDHSAVAEVRQILRNDDICTLAFRISSGWRNNLAAFDPEMTYPFSQIEASSQNPLADLFFRALYYSGLIDGDFENIWSPEKAQESWSQLFQQDPQNGAVPFFYMGFLRKQHGGVDYESLKWTKQVFASPRFTTYYTYYTKRIFLKSFENTAAYIIGDSIRYNLPYYDHVPGYGVILKDLKNHPELNSSMYAWAKRIIDQAQPFKGSLEDIEWLPVEYKMAQLTVKHFTPDLPQFLPIEDLKKQNKDYGKQWDQGVDAMKDGKDSCNPTLFRDFVQREKEKYLKH